MGRTSDVKERLLQVAFELIWQHSYGSVGVETICKRANVKKGSFYHFFPSKSDLAVAAYEKHWEHIRPNYDRTFSPLLPPVERIENYCRTVYSSQCERRDEAGCVLGCPFASVGAELSTQDEKIRQKSQEIFKRICKYIETALRDAHEQGLIGRFDFAAKSEAIVCLVTGMLVQAKVRNDAEILRDLWPNIMQMVGLVSTVSTVCNPTATKFSRMQPLTRIAAG